MIGYVTLGTNDLDAAVSFYDELLGSIGATRTLEGDNFVAWGTGPSAPGLAVNRPFDGEPGPRGETFYAGYFRDLDGNKLNAFCMTQK